MFAFLSGSSDSISRKSLSKIFYDDLNYSSRWNEFYASPNLIRDKNIKNLTPEQIDELLKVFPEKVRIDFNVIIFIDLV